MESGGTELTSDELMDGLNDLGLAIEEKHGKAPQTTKFLMPYFDTGLDCINGGIECKGDCPDTLYPASENVYQAEACGSVENTMNDKMDDVEASVKNYLLNMGGPLAAAGGLLCFVIYWQIVRKQSWSACKFWGIGAIIFVSGFVIVFVPILVVHIGQKVDCTHYATIDSGPNDFYVAYGINHKATGHATYSSVNAYYYETLSGVASSSSEATPGFDGSAQVYLESDNPAAKYLYAVHFSRNCTESGLGTKYCLDVPKTGDMSLPKGGHIMFIGRMYIDPKTGAGPKANETIYDMLKHYYD